VQSHRSLIALPIAAALLLAVTIVALGTGAVRIPPARVVAILLRQDAAAGLTDAMHAVIWSVRLPRVLLALVAGSGLAMCGVLMQALFRNPLADPALIGVSAGAALGAVAVIVLGTTALHGLTLLLGYWTLPVAAFGGALATATLVFRLARRDGAVDPTTMLLCGIAINALTGSGIGLLTFMATDEQLRNLTFWTLGSLGSASLPLLLGAAPAVLALLLASRWLAPSLNALLLGESEALHLGVAVERLKRIIIMLTAAAAGAVVAAVGVIGFVGLVAPHVARLLVGPDHRAVLPLSALLGATLLTAGDIVARTLVRPAELPIGILTALIGAPFFLWLLRRPRAADE
jgi:iron complex transport system permease protein